jgi:tetratricopeptide (TPR) repeat protein
MHVLVGAGLGLVLSACAEPQVVRVYEGNPVAGRFIEYEAYAAYGRGLEAERDRNFRVAARWFQEAANYDPKSVEIPTHLGAALCALGALENAADVFADAEKLDPMYAPLFRARAKCAVDHAQLEAGSRHARHAFELDPEDEQTVVIYASILRTQQKYDEAGRLLDSFLLRHPNAVEAWRERLAIAQLQHDRGMNKKSAEALVRLAPRMAEEVIAMEPSLAPLAKVDAAIRQGNIDEARKAARLAHLPPAELALRAAAMGASKLAREQAEHVLGADPSSTSARVALASASDALEDAAAVGKALELPMNERLTPLSPLGRLVFAELLVRHAEREAARAFIGSLEVQEKQDPVYEALRLHLVSRLGGTNPVKVGGT